MGLEVASYISGLDVNNPAGSDDIAEGDNHLKLIKTVLKNTLPNADEAINGIHTGTSEPSPNTAGQLWFDPSGDGVLKVRNKADDGWDNVGAGKLLAAAHNYRSGYTDIASETMTNSGLAITYTKLSATSTLYVDFAGETRLSTNFNWPASDVTTQSGFIRLVYATSTTTGIVPATDDNANHIKEQGFTLSSGSVVQLGFGTGYIWKITGLAVAEYTFKVQGKVSNEDVGSIEFSDGTIRLMEVEA